ncbi:hypothetical protein LI82_05065 [Methanococcoides methylutens]|uniref:Uncharacterized protein n=1 Tax=Methanococcoides methylutens TaxID=2226 RepID=A0A099T599_METMT|nr:hypothetical protein [Methanococcoides methylutens]KGK99376.1 hypothetical protein LI82_05065 [Methanococcoides methylutens]
MSDTLPEKFLQVRINEIAAADLVRQDPDSKDLAFNSHGELVSYLDSLGIKNKAFLRYRDKVQRLGRVKALEQSGFISRVAAATAHIDDDVHKI